MKNQLRIQVLGLVVLALVGLAQVEPGECAGSPKQPRRQQTVYNHTTAEGAHLDALVHQFYQTNFRIVDYQRQRFCSGRGVGRHDSPRIRQVTDTGEKLAGRVRWFISSRTKDELFIPLWLNPTDERLNPTASTAMEAWRFRPKP